MAEKIDKPIGEWKKLLPPDLFHLSREKGTEPPFSGKYYYHKEEGVYLCASCGQVLFSSQHKFDSGSGWPSFFQPLDATAIEEGEDHSYGMERVEVRCSRCSAHLGHLFEDGPKPSGLRYCINSGALDFKKNENLE